MRKARQLLSLFIFIALFCSCKKDPATESDLTKKVIIVVIDGSRYSETWGDSSRQNIPHLAGLAGSGVISSNFYNYGPTYTLAGHTAVTTGFYQEINNSGAEIPTYPSLFQYFNAVHAQADGLSWIISSKNKLEVLSDCRDTAFHSRYRPEVSCGVNGLNSDVRSDSITFTVLMQVLNVDHPDFVLVSFAEPDILAHQNNYPGYIKSIRSADRYIYELWQYIQKDSFYKDKTALFVTNDHGRHLDGIADGFVSHGDGCEGCRHIFFFAAGPDFRKGVVTKTRRQLVDITATIAKIFNLDMKYGNGKVMDELFR